MGCGPVVEMSNSGKVFMTRSADHLGAALLYIIKHATITGADLLTLWRIWAREVEHRVEHHRTIGHAQMQPASAL